jgi:hypothetical protein
VWGSGAIPADLAAVAERHLPDASQHLVEIDALAT